jgi:EmrB/QacA subfamily drug resistance transporter
MAYEQKQKTAVFTSQNWQILTAICIMAILIDLDLTIVNLATASIAKIFSATFNQIQKFVSIYSLSAVIVMIFAGQLADGFLGKKKVYLIGLFLFLIGSIVAGFANSIFIITVGRFFQGLGFGFTIAMGVVILTTVFPKEKHGLIIGVYMACMATAQALGPIIGGIIVQYFGWHWIFLINIPPTFLSFWLLNKSYRDESKNQVSKIAIDLIGALLLGSALFVLMTLLSALSENQIKPNLFISFLIDAFLFGVFYIHEKKISFPLFDFHLFSIRKFSALSVIRFTNMYTFGTILFVIPLYLQNIVGLSPMHAGLLLISLTIVLEIISPIIGVITDKIGFFIPTLLAIIIMLVALTALCFTHAFNLFLLIFILACIGLSIGIIATTSMSLLPRAVPNHHIGRAMGMFYTLMLLAYVFGISVSGILLKIISNLRLHSLFEQHNLHLVKYNIESMAAGIQSINNIPTSLHNLLFVKSIILQSFYRGFLIAFLFCLLLNALSFSYIKFLRQQDKENIQ